MRGLTALLALTLVGSLMVGCSPRVSVSRASSEAPIAQPVSQSDGRALADQVAQHLIDGSTTSLYEVMNRPFQESTPRDQFDVAFLFTLSGNPVRTEYKWDETGQVAWPDGSRHPMRKYWYALETERHDPGTYFLFVEVIPQDGKPVCSQFSVVSFPTGVPEQLK